VIDPKIRVFQHNRRIAVRAASSTHDQSFEHIYRIALALLLRLSERTPQDRRAMHNARATNSMARNWFHTAPG
jgi:hypothetical protein